MGNTADMLEAQDTQAARNTRNMRNMQAETASVNGSAGAVATVASVPGVAVAPGMATDEMESEPRIELQTRVVMGTQIGANFRQHTPDLPPPVVRHLLGDTGTEPAVALQTGVAADAVLVAAGAVVPARRAVAAEAGAPTRPAVSAAQAAEPARQAAGIAQDIHMAHQRRLAGAQRQETGREPAASDTASAAARQDIVVAPPNIAVRRVEPSEPEPARIAGWADIPSPEDMPCPAAREQLAAPKTTALAPRTAVMQRNSPRLDTEPADMAVPSAHATPAHQESCAPHTDSDAAPAGDLAVAASPVHAAYLASARESAATVLPHQPLVHGTLEIPRIADSFRIPETSKSLQRHWIAQIVQIPPAPCPDGSQAHWGRLVQTDYRPWGRIRSRGPVRNPTAGWLPPLAIAAATVAATATAASAEIPLSRRRPAGCNPPDCCHSSTSWASLAFIRLLSRCSALAAKHQ